MSVVETVTARERSGHQDGERGPLGPYAGFIVVYNAALGGTLLSARLLGRELPRPTAGDVVLFGVATHKLSRLLAKDKVTAAIRAPFTEYEAKGGPAEVEERPAWTWAAPHVRRARHLPVLPRPVAGSRIRRRFCVRPSWEPTRGGRLRVESRSRTSCSSVTERVGKLQR